MNPIVSKQRIDFYLNLTKNARFTFAEYAMAANDVIDERIDFLMGDIGNRNPENFEWVQRISDSLYTLIKVTAPVVTPGTAVTNKYYSALPSTFPAPADYKTFVYLTCIIDSLTVFVRPTTFNKIGPLLRDSFRHPTNEKPYYIPSTTGMTIWRSNSGSLSSAALTYIKTPTDFSIGQESNLINAGGTLTNLITYYATEVSVYAATTYAIGATITGTGAALTSGQVIPVSATSPIDLPSTEHELICRLTAERMLLTVADINQSMAIKSTTEGE